MKLYEINEMFEKAYEQIELYASEHDGEIPEDWDSFITAIEMERAEKILSIGRWIKNLESDAEAIKAEETKLADRRHTIEAKTERIKSWLQTHVPTGEKLSDANTVISWRKSTQTIIEIGAEIPDVYCKIEKKPILSELKRVIQSGEKISGVSLLEKQSIQIK